MVDKDEMRTPFFVAAVVLMAVVILIEVGSSLLSSVSGMPRPGLGIPYMACIDGLMMYALVLMTISKLGAVETVGRLQGLVGFFLSLILLIVYLVMIIAAFVLLILEVSLLLAPIFGTIAYFVIFADFDRSGAAVTLGLVLTLKLVFAACVFLAQQSNLFNKSLMLLLALSLGSTLLVSILQQWPPGFLASITDVIAALVIAVVAIIWALVLLVGSVIGFVRAVV